tara:strand:+ start:9826 stop:9948 length:123 start_codon:yes stop_codon:yes gene_type:complete
MIKPKIFGSKNLFPSVVVWRESQIRGLKSSEIRLALDERE